MKKLNMKKIFSALLAVLIVFSLLPQHQTSASTFSDVPNSHRFYNDISYLLNKGVISPASKYGVDDKVTRAEVAIMVSKSLGLDGTKRETTFKDVSSTHQASGHIASAVEAKIISGFPDGTYRPNELVDRGQMAIFLARAFKLSEESPANFKDMSPSVASYSSVKKIIQAGITSGFSDNTFRPTEKLTRGQISAFLARAMQDKNVATPTPPSSGKDMLVHYIDVGQGDAILIQSPNGKNMLIDGGPKSAGDKVVSFLKSKGVSTLDIVVATHPDADHIGGLIAVLNNFKVNQVIDSGKVHTTQTYYEMLQVIDSKNIPFTVAETNDTIDFDLSLKTTVLYADENAKDNNDASIVIRTVYGSVSFLFTADAATNIESKLLSRNDLKSTYLKAGHHGSNTSSSAVFLNAVKPVGTILSYKENNSYGHPHAEVVERLKAIGTTIYSTAESGDITITTNGSTHSVSAKPWVGSVKPAPVTPTPVVPKPEPKPEPKPDLTGGLYVIPGAPTSFTNCTAMRVYYPYGVRIGHPAYAKKHDRDGDGWACER